MLKINTDKKSTTEAGKDFAEMFGCYECRSKKRNGSLQKIL